MAPTYVKLMGLVVVLMAGANLAGAETSSAMACEDYGGITYDGNICCAEECGECGGKGCKDRPGGKHACCTQRIMEANMSCDEAGSSPCMLTKTSPTPAPATEAPATPTPVTEAPATPAPATEAPATPAPVTEAPVTMIPATAAPIDATSAPATATPVAGTSAPVTIVPSTTMTEYPVAEMTIAPTVEERGVIFSASPTEAIMAPTILPTSAPTHATIHPSSTPTSTPTMIETIYPTAAPLVVFEETFTPTTAERGIEFESTFAPTSAPTSALTSVQPSLVTDAPVTTPSPSDESSGAGQVVPLSGVMYACVAGLLIAVGILL